MDEISEKDARKSATMGADIDSLKKSRELHDQLIYLVIIVLLVGFAAAFISVGGFVVTYESQNESASEGLRDQILLQNQKIDNLTKTVGNFSTSTGK